MSQTYRIKLETGRVVGPLDVEDLKDLYLEGAITCNEEVQEFPAGEWRSFNSFKELVIGIKSVGGKLRYQELVKKEKIEIDFDNFNPGEISLDNSSRKKKDIQFEEGFEGEIDLNTGDYRKHRPTKKKFEFDPEQKTEINPDYQEYLKKLKAEKEQEEKQKGEHSENEQERH